MAASYVQCQKSKHRYTHRLSKNGVRGGSAFAANEIGGMLRIGCTAIKAKQNMDLLGIWRLNDENPRTMYMTRINGQRRLAHD